MGPLQGVKIVELAGIGPGPHCCMLLADMGADILRVDRTDRVGGASATIDPKYQLVNRGRRNVAIDLKSENGKGAVLRLCERADIVIEGYRPGVIERLGLGPDILLARNPRLVIGRMTGWGQNGPLAQSAGHDINYISIAGALAAIGTPEAGPVPPLNLIGDFGGGSLYLAMGVLAGLVNARATGKGQVVDTSMVEGTASLMTMFYGLLAAGRWNLDGPGTNRIDGGSHFYNVYETRDGKHISFGSIEPQFYALLLKTLGLTADDVKPQNDAAGWAENRARIAEIVRSKTRDEWDEIMAQTDICYAPVLNMEEALSHPQNVARESFVDIVGVPQPAPVPKFSETPGAIQRPPASAGEHTRQGLADWGFSEAEIAALENTGDARQA